jgi:hypothetical protein
VLRQNAYADFPGCHADSEGENDRSLINVGHQNPTAQPGANCQIEFQLIHMMISIRPKCAASQLIGFTKARARSIWPVSSRRGRRSATTIVGSGWRAWPSWQGAEASLAEKSVRNLTGTGMARIFRANKSATRKVQPLVLYMKPLRQVLCRLAG